jgi:hypothetical protein
MAIAKGVYKYSVALHRKEYQVSVNQQSEAVWRAVGWFGDELIEATGRSESTALAKWKEQARYKSNL